MPYDVHASQRPELPLRAVPACHCLAGDQPSEPGVKLVHAYHPATQHRGLPPQAVNKGVVRIAVHVDREHIDWHVATLRTVDPITGVEQHDRKNLARADLNEKEIALLEMLRAPEVYVEAGWDALVRSVRAAARAGEIRVDLLKGAVPGEYNRTVRDNFARLEAVALDIA